MAIACRTWLKRFSLLAALLLAAGGARAQSTCSAYPYILANNTVADATQVMADFNNILNCVQGFMANGFTTTGPIIFGGASSGAVTVQPQAAAGTYNFNLPTTAGTVGQVLLSGGGGAAAMTFGAVGVAGGGTGLSSGTSGGILGFTASTTLASSAALAANGVVIGGGAGATPTAIAACTNGQLIVGATSSPPACQTMAGDVGSIGATGIVTLVSVNGVLYGSNPSSNTVPVVTGAFTTTYEAVPNAALANSSVTIGSTNVALGATVATFAGVTLTSPTETNTTITGSLTAIGLVTNANLVNAATTVNGQTCTLGSTCTAAAAAGTLTGTTLASNVVTSSLTTVGTIGTGIWNSTFGSSATKATNAAFGIMEGDTTTISCTAGVCTAIGAAATSITVGTTTVGSGTNTRIEFNNSGTLGEYAVSGTGSVCMTTSCSMTTPAIGAATGTSLALGGATLGGNALAVTGTTAHGGAISFTTGLGAINQIQGPSDQAFNIFSTNPAAAASTAGGNSVTISASDATAGTTNAGAQPGGAILIELGSARQKTSGNANGGNIELSTGTGIGTGTTGGIDFAQNGVAKLDLGVTTAATWTFSAPVVINGTSLPLSITNSTTGAGCSISTNGQGCYGAGTGVGALVFGQGSADDVALSNKSGAIALSVPTGTQNIVVGGSIAATLASAATTSAVCFNTGTGLLTYDGTIGTCTVSSMRFKHDIEPLAETQPDPLGAVMAMRPKSFFYNKEMHSPGQQVGLIAEDLAAIDPRLVSFDQEGKPNAIRFLGPMNAYLVGAIQEQQYEIADFKAEIADLKAELRRRH